MPMTAQELAVALNTNVDDYRDLIIAYQGALATSETQKAVLVAANAQALSDLNDAVQAKLTAQAQKDAVQTLYDQAVTAMEALVARTDAVENDARAGLPGVPPIETPTDPATPPVDPDPATPTDPVVVGILAPSYADRASFDAAVAAYSGVEQVTLDGAEVKAASDAAAAPANYFSHSADGSIDLAGPTD